MKIELRPYQEEARQAIQREWQEGRNKTLLVLPTGTGKTIVFSKVIEDRVREGDRVLVLAHRGELLDQAADKLYQATGLKVAVEKAEQSCLGSWNRVVVGSVQTMMGDKRLAEFEPDYFQTIVVDEAHHAISPSYQKVLNHFEEAKVLGVTATPDRGDMKNLGSYFESLAYEYSLPEAIRSGYLSPIKALTIPLELDLSGVGQGAGDFKASDLGTVLDPYLEQIADEMLEHCSDRKTVVFLPLIATSQKFCEMLKERGFKAAEVNGESKDRDEILEDFENNKYEVLCNSMLLTEGWDSPAVDCIVVLRPTRIRSLYSQMVGRGTRLSPGKDHLLVLDFLWHTERHDLVHPAHLIATSEDVANKMTEKIEEAGAAIDIEDIFESSQKDVIEEREQALANELKAMRRRKQKLVDPVQYEMSIEALDLANYEPSFGWEMLPPSDGQIKTIEKFGLNPDTVGNSGKASLIIDKLIKRSKMGLATPKQIRLLEQRGFEHVGSWKFEEAQKMIGRIASNGWRMPRGVVPSQYEPGKEM